MARVISEYALPFIRRCPGNLVIADDAMNYGSTFSRTIDLAKEVGSKCEIATDVIGLPFAVSDDASGEYKSIASKYFLRLGRGEAAAFVHNEVTAFRLLGKPFDIDHPILTFSGDFADRYRLEGILNDVATSLRGTLIPIETNVPVANGQIKVTAWTMLLDPCPNKSSGTPGVCKLRIYVEGDSELRVAAMSPFTVNRTDLGHLKSVLSPGLKLLWEALAKSGECDSQMLKNASHRSLATWASFLASMFLLHSSKESFLQEFSSHNMDVSWVGPRQDDLRLLLGPEFAESAERELDALLASPITLSEEVEITQPSINDLEKELIPTEYVQNYQTTLEKFLRHSSDVDDALKSVFYAQHTAIELPSRRNQNGNNRLQFGLAYGRLRSLIHQTISSTDDAILHRCLDRLIDDGCVVPLLVNVGDLENEQWIHVFRVGEGPIPTTVHTLRLLFGALSSGSASGEVPRLLFEKFCALALAVAVDNKDLIPLQKAELKKGFHLYGARMVLNTGQKETFLLDWAVEHNILSRRGAADDEYSSSYRLNPNLDTLFPATESPWDADVKDAVEDLALLVKSIDDTKGLKGPALIAMTSVATNRELHTAVETELDLWLHDERFSVYDGLRQLADLASKISSGKAIRDDDFLSVWHVLSNAANFTAQVNEKKLLADRRDSIYLNIDALAATDTRMQRSWRKLRLTLDGRVKPEELASGYVEILSALRIAYGTNRLLRDLLALAGYPDLKGKSQPIEKSVEMLRTALDDRTQVDQATRTMFAAKDKRPDVSEMLLLISDELPYGFPKALDLLRPPVYEIASRCEDVLRSYSAKEQAESKQALEPPKYIVMWDIRGSTNAASRDPLQALIGRANRRIADTLGSRAIDFKPDRDDGNGLICETFSDVLTVFQILTEVYAETPFRAGCEVNLQGRLDYYPKTKELGGRAFEFAARIAAMFKELESDHTRWSGGARPTEPTSSYLVIGEFAHRYATTQNEWSPNGFQIVQPAGQYHARVRTGLPISVTIILPGV
jgi:hypothetical protein